MPSAPFTRVLAVLAVVLLAISAYAGYHVIDAGAPLKQVHSAAPRGLLNLQIPINDSEAHRIIAEWSHSTTGEGRRLVDVANDALKADYWFILSYVLAWLVTAVWAWRFVHQFQQTPLPGTALAVVLAMLVMAGLADACENLLIALQLGHLELSSSVVRTHAIGLTRTAAMTKFVLLMGGVLTTLTLVGAAWRLAGLRRRPEVDQAWPEHSSDFESLVLKENDGIFSDPDARTPDRPVVETNVPADEPWVAFRAADLIGLALSGGGIRSATFNLGLIEGLQQLNLLRLFDYVSTVSGGGYIGSMWSAWLAKRRDVLAPRPLPPNWTVPADDLFPSPRSSRTPQLSAFESDPERHLREFSRFLAPRWGFIEVEMWTALVAVLSGLLPALVIALSVIGVVAVFWLTATFPLACDQRAAPLPVIGVLTALVLLGMEYWWEAHKLSPAPDAAREASRERKYLYLVIAAVTLVLAVQAIVPTLYFIGSQRWFGHSATVLPVYIGGWHSALGQGGYERWWDVAGILNSKADWVLSPRLFDYGLVWLAVAVLFIGGRLLFAVWPYSAKRQTIAAFDRVLMRLLGLGVLWIALALVWHLAVNIGQVRLAVTAALISGGTFAALRNWIGLAFRRPAEAGPLDRIKPYVPMALAWITVVLAAVLVGHLLIRICGEDWLRWWAATFVQGFVLVVGLFIMPGEFGLHKFYSERISRAYAGASNLSADQHADGNRSAEPRVGDERRLEKLVGRPLQLICCAANDLTGDPVATLSRGARSAVLSKYGLAIGADWTTQKELRLGEAVTASAAAFNSNMGKVSLEVGPAVSFLMTALNLRLGLWLRHPSAALADRRRWPGLLFYREMFGQTAATGREPDGSVGWLRRDVHLSDGGHFENLALYELVRRHCRYILLSDCGADPEVAFDDLGNALRRIREDFGVDVELDVAPLYPVDGRSRQHVAIGTIHYSESDRGILLYVKPTITGNEPPDVRQYKTRNTAFPHESTTDQFYDEAQWESYRKLGAHTAREIFDFVLPADLADTGRITADWVFAEATHRWGPTPEGLEATVLEMTKRFAEAEKRLRTDASERLLAEVFPELSLLGVTPPTEMGEGTTAEGAVAAPTGASTDLLVLVRATELMEDVWTACDLDTWWDHPLNLGWINTFARWATAPSFRFWWPLVAPMFSPGFRSFIEDRFPTPPPIAPREHADAFLAGVVQRGELTPFTPGQSPTPLAELWWTTRSTQPRNWDQTGGRRLYQELVKLQRSATDTVEVQVGIAAVTWREASRRAGWTDDDFFVPPSLWGTGLGWYFLHNLLDMLHGAGCVDCHVVVKAPPEGGRTKVAMDDRRSFVEHYRKMGFRQRLLRELPEDPLTLREFRKGPAGSRTDGFDDDFARALGYQERGDALLVLDLGQWARNRGR